MLYLIIYFVVFETLYFFNPLIETLLFFQPFNEMF